MTPRYERDGDLPPPPEPLRTPVADAHCHLDLMGSDLFDALAMSAAVGVRNGSGAGGASPSRAYRLTRPTPRSAGTAARSW